ncbi:MAG TPA: hypothetical protein PKE07_07660 [Lacibacter sp.]|nr:hypothetical protein [Lacibacter sp.]HMO88451.1 hypothetical protein [Lacibacter sp.]
MGFEVVFHPEATIDLAEALIWYESKSTGLGQRFLLNFDEAIRKINTHPDRYGFIIAKLVRRCVLKKFPYAVHYLRKENCIHILGVYHIKRSNAFKRKRLR